MRTRPSVRTASRAIAVLGVAVLVATACGQRAPHTTLSGAPVAGGAAGSSAGGGGLSLPSGSSGGTGAATGGGGSVSGGGGGSIGGGTSSGGTTSGGTTGGGTTGGGTTGGTSGGGGATFSAPGVTATAINIGVAYVKNQGAANAAIGAGAINQDQRKPLEIVINDVNQHGGILGRKLVPIWHAYDANSNQTADQQDQAACADWSQDHHVLVMDKGNTSVIDECAKKAGAIEFGGGVGGDTPATYQRYPTRIDIDAINIVRVGQVTVDGLYKAGYFAKGAKIGIVTWDDPIYRQGVESGYIPALKRHGLSLGIAPAYLQVPAAPQDIGQTSAAVSTAVLRFQSAGIDHVMILDGAAGACGGACITLEWVQQANSQHYYPAYGFNDTTSAKEIYQLGLFTKQEMERAVSVGWIDLNNSYDTGEKPNASRAACFALMRKHGVNVSDAQSQNAALAACTQIWFLRMALDRIQGTITVDKVVAGIDSLGYGYTSPSSYGNFFSAMRHDGAAGVRIVKFFDSCSCFKYVTNAYRV